MQKLQIGRSDGLWLSLFLLVLLAELTLSASHLSITTDENAHIAAGFASLSCSDYSVSPEHPPFSRMISALPVVFSQSGGDHCRTSVLPDPEAFRGRSLFLSRCANMTFSVALVVLVWACAKEWSGQTAARIAGALCIFEPNLLAHGALVTNDVALSAMLLLTVFMFWRWITRRTALDLVLAGTALGLTLTTKFSGIIVLPILACLASIHPLVAKRADLKTAGRNLIALAGMCAIAYLVIWTVYGFRYTSTPSSYASAADQAAPVSALGHLLPEAFITGAFTARSMGAINERPAFLLGDLYTGGHWYYFPVAALIKLTVPTLLLAIFTLPSAFRKLRQGRPDAWFVVVPFAFYLALCMFSRLNIGFRHALPLVPFVLIAIGSAASLWMDRWPAAKYGLLALLLFHAATSLHAFPYYIPYANEMWGGPLHSYQYLSDSNVDWGEGLGALEKYASRTQNSPCWAVLIPGEDATGSNIACEMFAPETASTTVRGTVIISSTWRSGIWRETGLPSLEPFPHIAPSEVIAGGSLLVYKGDFDLRVPAGVREILAARDARMNGQMAELLAHARRAVELVPESPAAHAELCAASLQFAPPTGSPGECAIALDMAVKDPYFSSSELVGLRALANRVLAGAKLSGVAAP